MQPLVHQLEDVDALKRLAIELRLIESEESSSSWRTAGLPDLADPPSQSAAKLGLRKIPNGVPSQNDIGLGEGSSFSFLRKGATDLKLLLTASRAFGLPLAIAWMNDEADDAKTSQNDSPLVDALRALAVETNSILLRASSSFHSSSSPTPPSSPVLVLAAYVGESASNKALATALKVQSPPVFHIYQDMQVCHCFLLPVSNALI